MEEVGVFSRLSWEEVRTRVGMKAQLRVIEMSKTVRDKSKAECQANANVARGRGNTVVKCSECHVKVVSK